jgi:DNA-directed RNA polymerase specialized sigma24 family protein
VVAGLAHGALTRLFAWRFGAWLVTAARSRALDRVRSLGSRRRAGRGVRSHCGTAVARHADPASAHARRLLRKDGRGRHRARAAAAPGRQARLSKDCRRRDRDAADTPLGTVKSWTRQALLKLRERVAVEALP